VTKAILAYIAPKGKKAPSHQLPARPRSSTGKRRKKDPRAMSIKSRRKGKPKPKDPPAHASSHHQKGEPLSELKASFSKIEGGPGPARAIKKENEIVRTDCQFCKGGGVNFLISTGEGRENVGVRKSEALKRGMRAV